MRKNNFCIFSLNRHHRKRGQQTPPTQACNIFLLFHCWRISLIEEFSREISTNFQPPTIVEASSLIIQHFSQLTTTNFHRNFPDEFFFFFSVYSGAPLKREKQKKPRGGRNFFKRTEKQLKTEFSKLLPKYFLLNFWIFHDFQFLRWWKNEKKAENGKKFLATEKKFSAVLFYQDWTERWATWRWGVWGCAGEIE